MGSHLFVMSFVILFCATAQIDAQSTKPLRRLNELEGQINQLLSEKISTDWNQSQSIQEKLAKAELLFELGEYDKSTILAFQIVQHGGNLPAQQDALFLLGESLFRLRDYEGARKKFTQLIEKSLTKNRSGSLEKRALSRLMEISIHTRKSKNLQSLLSNEQLFSKTKLEPSLSYSYGKLLYNQALDSGALDQDTFFYDPDHTEKWKQQFDASLIGQAFQYFSQIPSGDKHYVKAQYFVGVIHTINGNFEAATQAFEKILSQSSKDIKSTSSKDSEINELTYLALGRLYYETGSLAKAIFSYQQISPNSPRFDVALFEIAWVFVRLGDAEKAERSLDLLTLAIPTSPYAASGRILRGKLLTRYGKYEGAQQAFSEVKQELKPSYDKIRELDSSRIIEEYMSNLVIDNLSTFDASMLLPKGLKKWAEKDEKINQSLMTYLDVGQLKKTVDESEALIGNFEAVLELKSPIRAFSDLRRHLSETKRFQETLSTIQKELIEQDTSLQNINSEELSGIRKQKVNVERKLKTLSEQEESGLGINDQFLGLYKKLERQLKGLEVESLGLQARLTAMNQFLSDSDFEKDFVYEGDGEKALRSELERQNEGLKFYHIKIQKIQDTIGLERIKLKTQDFHGSKVRVLVEKLTELQNKERAILKPLLTQINPGVKIAFEQIERQQRKLDEHEAVIDESVSSRTQQIQLLLEDEKKKLEVYRTALVGIQEESSQVIGGISFAYMQRVAEKLYGLVIEADVGLIDVAWAEREEHRRRVDTLSRERSQEIQKIDKEFKEISDDLPRGGGL